MTKKRKIGKRLSSKEMHLPLTDERLIEIITHAIKEKKLHTYHNQMYQLLTAMRELHLYTAVERVQQLMNKYDYVTLSCYIKPGIKIILGVEVD